MFVVENINYGNFQSCNVIIDYVISLFFWSFIKDKVGISFPFSCTHLWHIMNINITLLLHLDDVTYIHSLIQYQFYIKKLIVRTLKKLAENFEREFYSTFTRTTRSKVWETLCHIRFLLAAVLNALIVLALSTFSTVISNTESVYTYCTYSFESFFYLFCLLHSNLFLYIMVTIIQKFNITNSKFWRITRNSISVSSNSPKFWNDK